MAILVHFGPFLGLGGVFFLAENFFLGTHLSFMTLLNGFFTLWSNPREKVENLQISDPPTKKWDKSGVVDEKKDHDQYWIKIDGSGRLTLRNRRFLRAFTAPIFDAPIPGPAPVSTPQQPATAACPRTSSLPKPQPKPKPQPSNRHILNPSPWPIISYLPHRAATHWPLRPLRHRLAPQRRH